MNYEQLIEGLDSLRFYHPSDEVGELFESVCRTALKAAIHDSEERVKFLYDWAVEMAKDSEAFCIEMYGKLDDDWITGRG